MSIRICAALGIAPILKKVLLKKLIGVSTKLPKRLMPAWVDTKGPEYRIKTYKNGSVILKDGDTSIRWNRYGPENQQILRMKIIRNSIVPYIRWLKILFSISI